MELYVFENYRELFPHLSGSSLTDRLVAEALNACGYAGACDDTDGPADMRILRTEKGKPYLPGEGVSAPYVSVSHSGSHFVCLIADLPVGVDLQHERNVDVMKISQRYFTREEQRYLKEGGGGCRDEKKKFFILWTRKEALSKYRGTGLEEIIKGTSVLKRTDVDFFDFQIEKGLYCSCCMMKKKKDI
ncbi:MAG: 4'-phosphopantetheinyl transferase superfamily protein [Bacillota bacterium]|nr:4'-phosphopantetheinyl transferase superfamily protein [Bacillota bacterium]